MGVGTAEKASNELVWPVTWSPRQGGRVDLAEGDPGRQLSGVGRVRGEPDETHLGERPRPGDDLELPVEDPDLEIAAGESGRDGLGLAGQLVLGGRDRRPADEEVAADGGDHQRHRDQQEYRESEPASHPMR